MFMGNMVVPSERGVPIKLRFSPEPISVVIKTPAMCASA